MKPNRIMCIIPAGIVAGIFMFSSCHSGYSLASVEGSRIEVTAALDANPDSAAIAVLAPYQKTVDSIMSPVIGQSARFMDRFRPESELSNLVADILRYSASAYIGRMADVGVTNMGGLRTALPEGDITYGNIYEITPFENTLCIVTMNGVLLRELFENIAAVHGEGLSGACLEISGDGKLLDATVAGKEIEDSKEYKVATLDYLAEGNDHMTAFAKVGDADKLLPEKATVRQLFLNYVNEQTKAGKKIDSKIEGRITWKEKNQQLNNEYMYYLLLCVYVVRWQHRISKNF